MGCPSALRLGIFTIWVAGTISFAPTTRNAIAALRTSSSSSNGFHKFRYNGTWSRIRSRKDKMTTSDQGEEEKTFPSIRELRNELRKELKNTSPQGAIKAKGILDLMFLRYGLDKNTENTTVSRNERRRIQKTRPMVDAIDCTQVINAWSKSRRRDAPQQALATLRRMYTTFQKDGNPCIRPDNVAYNSVINAFAKQGDFNGACSVFALQTEDFKEGGNTKAKPDAYTFSTMINACSRSNREDLSETAEKLLTTMNDWHARGDLEIGPSTMAYNSVINCFSKSDALDAPERARRILETMVSRFESIGSDSNDGHDIARPNAITYNSVLNAHARRGDVEGATEVFERMKKDFESGNNGAKPQVQTYNILIDGWSKSNNKDAPENAESLLQEIIRMESEGKFERGEGPDCITYSAVINCFSKSNAYDAPTRARTILETMISEYENSSEKNSVRPDTVVYGSLMNAYARQGDTKGASEVFDMMKKDYHSGNQDAEPNVPSYNILIDAWSKSNNEDAPNQVELLLKEMIQMCSDGDIKKGPDAITYGAVINCYSKSNLQDAPQRARDLLESMIAQCKGNDTKEDIRPNTITYAAVMDAYARQGDAEGATEIFEMLKRDKNCKPNVQTFTILIDAWSKSNSEDAPLEAALLLQEMMGMSSSNKKQPKTGTLQKDSLGRARDVLAEVFARYSYRNMYYRPDTVTYNAIMNAFAKRGDVQGATAIFNAMDSDYSYSYNKESRTHEKTGPDVRTYNILLDAWARSSEDNASAESERILKEMNHRCDKGEAHMKPDSITYRTVIRCLELFEGTEKRIEELKSIPSSAA
ncbi:unnamed protein product [Pseudo-nitzschia multistriata]|uniref:Pentacotripeptide-repeat region of PRORP domain-containing protein n=1 Tax=Pseudo-nitzschia multistriata TaxID=183589 RepID=A0A448ZE14_9STRA|nr:unnamed protein product [Pseudo-nitzschia multistriata]